MTTALHDDDSIPSSTTVADEKCLTEESEVTNAGDVEARRTNIEEEKIDSETELDDPYLVKWNGVDDPGNPLNFSTRRKLLVMVMIAAIAFLTYIPESHRRGSPILDLPVLQCFHLLYPRLWQSLALRTQFWVHSQSQCLSLVMRLDLCSNPL